MLNEKKKKDHAASKAMAYERILANRRSSVPHSWQAVVKRHYDFVRLCFHKKNRAFNRAIRAIGQHALPRGRRVGTLRAPSWNERIPSFVVFFHGLKCPWNIRRRCWVSAVVRPLIRKVKSTDRHAVNSSIERCVLAERVIHPVNRIGGPESTSTVAGPDDGVCLKRQPQNQNQIDHPTKKKKIKCRQLQQHFCRHRKVETYRGKISLVDQSFQNTSQNVVPGKLKTRKRLPRSTLLSHV